MIINSHIFICLIISVSSTNIETKYGRFKRGFAGMYETFGDSRQAAMDQMEDNQVRILLLKE